MIEALQTQHAVMLYQIPASRYPVPAVEVAVEVPAMYTPLAVAAAVSEAEHLFAAQAHRIRHRKRLFQSN